MMYKAEKLLSLEKTSEGANSSFPVPMKTLSGKYSQVISSGAR